MTTTPNTGQQYCPYGSEQASPAAAFCVGAIDIATAVPLAGLFAGGTVAAWASDLVAGLNLGTVLVSDLCSTPPIDPGPFDPGWFLGPSVGDNARGIIAWMIRASYLRLFQSCCRCNPPPAPSATLVGTITFDAVSGANRFFYITNPYPNQPFTMQLVIHNASPYPTGGAGTWVETLAVQCTNAANPVCSNLVAGSGSGGASGWGPAGCTNVPGSCGAYGSTITSPVFTVATAAQCVGMEVSFQGGAAGHFSGYVDIYVTPNTAIPLTSNQLVPPGWALAPSGAPSGTGVIPYPPEGTVFCNLAPTAAKLMQQSIVPQGENLISSVDVVGTGSWALPPDTTWVALNMSVEPTNANKDAGSPPRYYQVGWLVYEDVEGNEVGNQVLITALDMRMPPAPPDATTVHYNLFPGYHASLLAYGAVPPV